jgi:pyruvate dehydrogenase E1 component alpha subunit
MNMATEKATASKPKPKTLFKSTSKFDKETYIKWYEDMLVMRKIEEKAGHLYIQQKFGGFCHLYIGQEAIVSGMSTAIKEGDKIITAYRDHAHPIALGMHPKYMMAELYGKSTGCTKGKGGSMHMFDRSRNLMGGHGIVGAQIAMGAGVAFAEKYKGTKNVCLTFMGDGAVRQGILHETFNMAMIWNLPVLFIIENNNYAMGTSVERTSNVTELDRLALSYDMESYAVNGMSVEDVHDAIAYSCEKLRNGGGPILLDIRTYRYKGHSMSDPGKYRTKEEVERYKDQDPITLVLKTIESKKMLTKKQLADIEKKVKDIVNESVEFAETSPDPDVSELYKDVYMQEDYPYITE